MLTKNEKQKIKKICHLSEITKKDIVECVECYRNMIDDNDYHKARIIKYTLYTILIQNATDILLQQNVTRAIDEITAYEKLFSREFLDNKRGYRYERKKLGEKKIEGGNPEAVRQFQKIL